MSSFAKRTSDAVHHHRLRAAAEGASLDYDLADLRRLTRAALDAGPCPFCGRPLTDRNFSFDHAEPVCRGGAFDFANLTVCCLDCNAAKGPLTMGEFTALLAVLAHWPEDARRNTLARLRAGARSAKWPR